MSAKPVLLHPEAFVDLDHDSTVTEVCRGCVTEGGKRAVAEILRNPLYCVDTLRARARDVRELNAHARRIREKIGAVKEDEEGAAWCSTPLEDMDEDTASLLREPFFKGFGEPLNRFWPVLWGNNAYAMFLAPALALSAPMAYLLTPFLIIRYRLKLPIDFKTFVSLMYHSFKGAGATMKVAFGDTPTFAMQFASVAMTCVMYFQAVFASFRHSFRLVDVCQRVARRMNSLHRVLEKCEDVVDDRGEDFFGRWVIGNDCPKNGGPAPRCYDASIRPWKFGFAVALRDFSRLDRTWIRGRLRRLFHLDAVCALCEAASAHAMGPVTFLPSSLEALAVDGGHRLKKDDRTNSVALIRGVNGAVLTGANASGKSTVLRMIGCVVLMAQTTGMAPARACALHPVKYISTMMGIRDDPVAGRSRFQNELLRAGECVEAARRRPGDVGLLLMDEIFGGTDPLQGDACGSKVLSSLADTSGCLYFLATHQRGLVEHSETLPSTRRYRMDPDYKMVPGVNRASNAAKLYREAIPS
jgi:hypothetical protein